MDTTRLNANSNADVQHAVDLLRNRELVALPTETVYGLGARGLVPEAVTKIFVAKGRPQDNPIILHVADIEMAAALWHYTSAAAQALQAAFWPGPLTLVAERRNCVPDVVTAGLSKVAVRLPAHPVMRQVIAMLGEPIAAPSANASTRPSPTTASDVLMSLDGRIAAVLDGGPCEHGIESTVVDVSGDVPVLLRRGAIDLEALRAVLPQMATLDTGHAHAAASPGLRHLHYRPQVKRVSLCAADSDAFAAAWASDAAVICRQQNTDGRPPRTAPTFVLPDDAAGFARQLFAALYGVERSHANTVVIADVPGTEAFAAVRDRLARATQ